MPAAYVALAMLLAPSAVLAYWEPSDGMEGTDDPYTAAIKASRQAAADPDLLKRDPDHFRRLFGQMAIEQNQAKSMDETQSTATPKDRCMVCHGVIVEFELMMKTQKGKGGRNALAVTEILEKICHLNRYHKMDGVDIKKNEERSRLYGGISPPVFANACKRVVDAWQDDDDEIEPQLRDGGDPKDLHKELRELICHRKGGMCAGIKKSDVVVRTDGHPGLMWKGQEEKCEDPNVPKKKKKKAKPADPITGA